MYTEVTCADSKTLFIDWKNIGTKKRKCAVEINPKRLWFYVVNWIHLIIIGVNVQRVKHYVNSCHKAEDGG